MDKSNEVTAQEKPEAEAPPAKFTSAEATGLAAHASKLEVFYKLYWKFLRENPGDEFGGDDFRTLLTDLRFYCEDHGLDYCEALDQAAAYPQQEQI